MGFPSPPWRLHGQSWLSLFYASPPGQARGMYAAAWVVHEPGSTVPHTALLVARRERTPAGRRLTVVAGWADSATAVEGARALFGFPVHAGALALDNGGLGPVRRAAWTVESHGVPVASADFADTSGLMVRTPVRGATHQPDPSGGVTTTALLGSGRTVPCLASWSVEPDGPLGWLAHSQPVASFRTRDARLNLG
jgi:hypothetical protein